MKLKILIVVLALTISAFTQTVKFQSNGDRAVFAADWLQETSSLDQYMTQYHELIQQKTIKSLALSFSYCKDPEYILKNIFKQIIFVQLLFINLDSCKIGAEGLLKMFSKINTSSVRNLHLNLNSIGQGQQIGKILGQQIAKFDLRSLKLNLMLLKLNDQGLINMFLHPLGQNIEELSLDLTANKLGPDSFQNFTHYLSKINHERVHSIELLVRNNRIESNGTIPIVKALKSFTKLTLFKFDAYFNYLKAPGVKYMSQLFKKLTNLKLLVLNFDLNYIQTQGGKLIGESIKNLTKLQFLQIGVSTKNFGFNGYHHILEGIKPLKLLKTLKFRCGVNRIGSKAATHLKLLLEQIPNLQYLQLNLVQNYMLDEGLVITSQIIPTMKSLKTFKLNFGFNEVKSVGVIELFKALEISNIANIEIGLSNNPLQDSQIQTALSSIKTLLSKSKKFQLQMLYTNISEDLMKAIQKLFDQTNKIGNCTAILHINCKEQMEKTNQQLKDKQPIKNTKQKQIKDEL